MRDLPTPGTQKRLSTLTQCAERIREIYHLAIDHEIPLGVVVICNLSDRKGNQLARIWQGDAEIDARIASRDGGCRLGTDEVFFRTLSRDEFNTWSNGIIPEFPDDPDYCNVLVVDGDGYSTHQINLES
jgi:hypothetical protein